VAGFSLGEADILRKAMGKKKPEVMAEQKEKFLDGAESRGVSRKKASALWEYIEPFAGYGFNKSHSVAYAMLAYKTAYLKAHHPVAFMSAMLTSEMSSKDNVAKYFQECREMGIAVLPPDVNESSWAFSAVGDSIRFGLGAVKGIGSSAVEAILEARRQAGRFENLLDFASKVDPGAINHKAFECLIKAGCFDELGFRRRANLEALDKILSYAQRQRREQEAGQSSLFAEGGATAGPMPDPKATPWPERDRLRYEKEALGLYLTGNPLSEYSHRLKLLASHDTESLKEGAEGQVAIGGLITRVRRNKIKSGPNAGRQMARFVLEDLEGTLPVAVFADKLQEYDSLIKEEAIVLIKGSARDRGSEVELTLEELISLEQAQDDLVDELRIDLSSQLSMGKMLELRDLLIENSGDVPVRMNLVLEGRKVSVTPEERFRVQLDDSFIESIERILGPGSVRKHHVVPISEAVH
jgi:DNA polymerase-3 subunit alpha